MTLTKTQIAKATYQGRRYTDANGNVKFSRYVVWDDEIKGFGLRITPSGRKSFILSYRANGRKRLMTLGAYGPLTLSQARKKAYEKLAEVIDGEDPLAERQEKEKEESRARTVSDLCDLYMELHAPKKKPSSIRADESLIRIHIRPTLGSQDIQEVNQQDVARFHLAMRKTPYQANRMLSLLSKMFNLAEQWGLRSPASNPCRGVKRYKEKKRERFLSREEIVRLGQVLDEIEETEAEMAVAILALRLLLLTGARKSEILKLEWSEVDFQRRCLRLADSKTGEKMIPLSSHALKLLKEAPRVKGNPYVCIGQKQGSHLVGIDKIWQRIREEADLEDVRMHDLRHSFAAVGAGGGLSLPMIGALLGHTQAQTTARYAHLASAPLHAATEQIGEEIAELLNGGASAEGLAAE